MGFAERLTRFSLRNTLALGLFSLLWSALAVWIYFSLPVSLLPNLNFPTLSIVVENPGLSSEELEKQVALPIESAMAGIYHVSRIRSTSVASLGLITVQLQWGANLELARQQVMQKLATLQGSLPAGSSVDIESLESTLGQVQSWILTGSPLMDLHEFALYRLKPLLLQQEGVYQVQIFGGLAPQYSLFVDPAKLEQYDLTLREVRDGLVRNNVAASGGLLDLGAQSFAVIPNARLTDQGAIERAVLAIKNGVPVRVRDIGRVTLDHLPVRGAAEREGQGGVVLQVVKQPDADTVAVARAVEAFFREHSSLLPPGTKATKYYDQSELVTDAIRGVEEAVVLGALLVGVILLVFLRSWRASLVAFISVPTSLLSALVFMHFLGMSLNIMTLGALAIATGMVIDDAIVVIENFFRHRALSPGDPVGEVFVRAVSEVAGPVASSTIATVAIFAPLAFLSGLAGRLFSPVGIVVSIVMTASLVFSLTLIPSVGGHVLKVPPAEHGQSRLARAYVRALDWSLKRWALVCAVALVLCVASGALLTRLNREFLPLLDEGSILMTMDAPPGASLGETLRVIHLLAKNVLQSPDIETVVSTNGHAPGMQDTDTMTHADVTAKLVPRPRRKSSADELMSLFRKRMEGFPGISADFTMPFQDKINDAVGGVAAAVGVKLFGDDLGKLQALAQELAVGMAKIPGVVDLRPSSVVPVPSLGASLIPGKADALGLARDDLNDTVQAMSYGVEATRIQELYRQVPLTLRFEGTQDEIPTLHFDELGRVPVRTTNGAYVPLSQVAELRFSEVPSRIDHEHATRLVTVSCNVSGVKNQAVQAAIQGILGRMKFPPGYSYELSGNLVAQSETTQGVAAMGIAALLLVAALLWVEFRSLRKTVLILLTIPLSTVGAALLLFVTGQTLNVSSLIGLVMLMGVVLRNGIVLVDYIHFATERGVPLDQAIEEGARVRLRPILMTALSEILGLMPLALGLGSGAELERPLALAVIGGLVTSTFLTLFVLPIGYRVAYRRGEGAAR